MADSGGGRQRRAAAEKAKDKIEHPPPSCIESDEDEEVDAISPSSSKPPPAKIRRRSSTLREASRSRSRSGTRTTATPSPVPSASSSVAVPSDTSRRNSRGHVDFVYFRVKAAIEIIKEHPSVPKGFAQLRINIESTDTFVANLPMILDDGVSFADIQAQRNRSRGGIVKTIAASINSQTQRDYPSTQFGDLDPAHQRAICTAALRAANLPAAIRPPPMAKKVYATLGSTALSGGGVVDHDKLKRPVCEALPPLPSDLADLATAKELGVDGRIAELSMSATQRSYAVPKAAPFFVSLTARLRTSCELVTPEKQELCVPSLDEVHSQRTHDRFLASGFGLHTYYAKDQTEERERQAQQIERVNNTKAMAIARHLFHLKVDKNWSDLAIRAWFQENVEDFAAPVHIPVVYDKKKNGRYVASFFSGDHQWHVDFASKEQAQAIADLAFQVIRDVHGRVGREKMFSLEVIELIKTRVRLAIVDTELDDEDTHLFTVGDDVYFSATDYHAVTDTWLVEADDDDNVAEASCYRCLCWPRGLHDQAQLFRHEDVWGFACNEHAASLAVKASESVFKQRGARMKAYIKRRDASRRIENIETSIVDEPTKVPASIYDCKIDWDFALLREALATPGLSEAQRIERLAPLIPGLSVEALRRHPTSIRPPLHVNAMRFVKAYTASPDQNRQYDDAPTGDGKLLGHTLDSCIQVPAHVQRVKKSAPLLDVTGWEAAVSIKATPGFSPTRQRELLDEVGALLGSYQELRSFCARAHSGHHMLPSHLAAISRDVSALVLDDDSQQDYEALREAIQKYSKPAPDIDAWIEQHKCSMQIKEDTRTALGREGDRIQQNIDEVAKAYEELSARKRQELIDHIADFGDEVDDHLEVPEAERAARRNVDNLPTGPFPTDTPTDTLFDAFYQAFIWKIIHCDNIRLIIYWDEEHHRWDRYAWRVDYQSFVANYAEHGPYDPFCGLEEDYSGTPHSPTSVTIGAHIDHTRSYGWAIGTRSVDELALYFEDRDALNFAPQMLSTNTYLKSDPPALVEQRLEWARSPVDKLFKKMQKGKMTTMTDEERQMIKDREKTLSVEQLAIIAKNGMTKLERAGARAWTTRQEDDSSGSSSDETASSDADSG